MFVSATFDSIVCTTCTCLYYIRYNWLLCTIFHSSCIRFKFLMTCTYIQRIMCLPILQIKYKTAACNCIIRCKPMIWIQNMSIGTQTVPNITQNNAIKLMPWFVNKYCFRFREHSECRKRSSFFDLFVDRSTMQYEEDGA